MLNAKTLIKLFVLSLVLAVPVCSYLYKHQDSLIPGKDKLFLSNLLHDGARVSRIIIKEQGSELSLQRNGDSWQLVEKNNYPVSVDKVEQLLFGLANLRIVEPKTSNPELYPQLGFDAQALEIILQDQQQQNLAHVIFGTSDGIELFARHFDEAQTWLLRGVFIASADFNDWFDEPLLGLIDPAQIKQLVITSPKHTTLQISKARPEQEDFTLVGKSTIKDQDQINSLPYKIAELEFEDVVPANAQDIDWQNALKLELEGFNGLRLSLDLVQHQGKVYGRSIATAPDSVDVNLTMYADKYNQHAKNWYYNFSPEFYNSLSS